MQKHDSIAAGVLQWAMGLYPPEKREWGEAILAESYEVTGSGAKLLWTLGGLNMALRTFLSNLFSFGPKRLGLDSGPQGSGAPIPWKRVLGCLTIAVALLLVPGFRQGLSLVLSSWHATWKFSPGSEIRRWTDLGRAAEARGDTDTMVYAALQLSNDEGDRLAKQAVAKDSSLTWIYYFMAGLGDHDRRVVLLSNVTKWDPDNAVPYLFQATYDPKSPEMMDRAVAAKHCDTYYARRQDLERRVMRKQGIHDPLGAGVWGQLAMPSEAGLNSYAALLVHRAEESGRPAVWEETASQLWALANLGSQVRLNAQTDAETFSGFELQEIAFTHLQPVLLKLGRVHEAQAAEDAARIELTERATAIAQISGNDRFGVWEATAAHVSLVLMIVCLLLITTGIFALMIKSRSKLSRFALGYAPAVLLLSCVGFWAASYPSTQAAKTFFDNPENTDAIIRLFSLWTVPWHVTGFGVYLWWAVIMSGSAVCMWLGIRSMRHRV